jgi:hypothetical protein
MLSLVPVYAVLAFGRGGLSYQEFAQNIGIRPGTRRYPAGSLRRHRRP